MRLTETKLLRTLLLEKQKSSNPNPQKLALSQSLIPSFSQSHAMKWSELPEPILLQRAFLFGITGIILGVLSILNSQLQILEVPMGPINGVSLLLQFFGLGTAVLVLKKRKLAQEFKEKSQMMILILTVALLFFIFSL